MKTLFIILALMGVSFGVADVPADSPTSHRATTNGTPSWDDVEAYILAHATKVDGLALSCLEYEASVGIQTWTLSDDTKTDHSVKDGPGLGWPAANVVIEFENTQEAAVAASLVLVVTGGGKANQ